MKLGEFNKLKILRFTSVGAYLADENDSDVLLPNKYLTDDMYVDDDIEVFLYRDSEDRLVATTQTPAVLLNSFALLSIKDVNFYGAFADWGLEKELMIPFKEQHLRLNVNSNYIVTLRRDESTDRLYGSTKINRYLENCKDEQLIGKPFQVLIGDTTELGVKVIVDNKYLGIVYHSDFNESIVRGNVVEGYIYHIRTDGKVDVRLGKPGYSRIDDNVEQLTAILKRLGKINLTDKSSPELIRETVGMSKKVFKQTVGHLYKERLIELKEDGIVWLK
ncbi:MAG: S1-like domain-containing RNA-binding protein [Crocinitomicaceae bacterium]|nr:S1-like domain-containing RNA-binding protein [Crocinitomicaceae bacterium]